MESTLYDIYALLVFALISNPNSQRSKRVIDIEKNLLNFKQEKNLFLKKTKKVTEKNQRAIFYFILLDSPIIGGATATAWRQLLQARNSPSPCER